MEKRQVMRYINHFSTFLKAKGSPHLNTDQMRRLLNIVALETKIKTLDDLELTGRKIYTMRETSKKSLEHLTKDLSPESLLDEMMRMSQN